MTGADERERRARQCSQLMSEQGWDALVASFPESLRYLGGVSSVSASVNRRTAVLAVVGPGGRVEGIVAPTGDVASLVASGQEADRIWSYGRFVFFGEGALAQKVSDVAARASATPVEAVLRALADLGLGGRVALEDDGLLPGLSMELFTAHVFLPTNQKLLALRQVKSAWEIGQLAQACEIAEQALQESIAGAREGTTDVELVQSFQVAAQRLGAVPLFAVMAIGEQAALADTPPVGRALRRGDMVRCDVGVTFEGYRADIARTACLGTPSAKVKAYYDAILVGEDHGIASLVAGGVAEQVFSAAVEGTRRSGIGHYDRSHVGHSIGLEVYDGMLLASGRTDEIRDNMVFCVETPYYEIGWGGVQVEDMVVVTPQGPRILNQTPRTLWEIS